MELLDAHFLHSLINYLHAHPHIGGLITFGIAFVESLALIGGLIPGSVVMTAIGALIGAGAMPMIATLCYAVAGAFVGDFLSYGLGAYYNERLKTWWPFRKHPQWLGLGEAFFARHGGKGVLIGRFFGPVRSLVPLIAGLMHMPASRFVPSAVVAAILWSVVYIVPGILVGALSLELPPATAVKFILMVLGIVAFGWVVFLLIHLFLKTSARGLDWAMSWLWQRLGQHRGSAWLSRLLSHSGQPNQHRQLSLLGLALGCGSVFVWLLYAMVHHGSLTQLNEPVFALLSSLRTSAGDRILLLVSLLGDKWVQFSAGLLVFAWLVWRRYQRVAWHWLGVIGLSAGTGYIVKWFYYSPRPVGLLNPQLTSSFPSGHTILATALFGFLAMVIVHDLPVGRRKTPVLIASILVFAVAFSRVYLGAHWLIDVLASVFLGLSCALFTHICYLRCDSVSLPAAALSRVAIGAFLMVWAGYSSVQFRAQQHNYTLYQSVVSMSAASWWQQQEVEKPWVILSRLGKPEAVLNVQWLGSLEDIRQHLKAQGWQDHPVRLNWKGSLSRLSAKANPEHLPVWPALYENQAPVLMMTRSSIGYPALYFVAWPSHISFVDTAKTLWVGSVHYGVSHQPALSFTPEHKRQLYARALRIFSANLAGVSVQRRYISLDEQPPMVRALNWNGEVLLIK